MEIWKEVIGYEGIYRVSNYGNIISLKANKESNLNPVLHHTGYLTCRLYKDKKWKERKIHRLVAELFVDGQGVQVNHIDGNKLNNHHLNLEYCSNRENALHRSLSKPKSSIYPGVCFDKQTGRWTSQCYFKGKQNRFGRFNSELEAYEAYLLGCKRLGITNKYS